MAVVISHFAHRGLVTVPNAVIDFLDGGRTAVALFFVLSGFILAYNYPKLFGKEAIRGFYVNRLARIYPVVLLSLAVAGAGVAFAWTNREQGLLESWYSLDSNHMPFLVASLFAQLTMITGWLPTASLNQPWNGPAWSISCEMFFYAAFPFLIAWLRDKSGRWLGWFLTLSLCLQVLFIAACGAWAPVGQRGFLVSQFPVTHLFEFLIGIVAALVFLRGGREWLATGHRREVVLGVALVAIVMLSAFQPISPAFLLMSPFFALLVLTLAVRPAKRTSWLAWSPLLLLGEASFSLYLLHLPLINAVAIFGPVPEIVGWLMMVFFVAISVGVFKVFETPSRLLVKRVLAPRRSRGRRSLESRPY
jgi:peptidoglycan/LPS O-acetylase OafA/YrhL